MTDFVRFCPGGRGGQLWSCQICSLEKIPLCMYVIDFSVRQLSNKKLSNKTTYIHTYIHTSKHHSDQIKSLRLDGATNENNTNLKLCLCMHRPFCFCYLSFSSIHRLAGLENLCPLFSALRYAVNQ